MIVEHISLFEHETALPNENKWRNNAANKDNDCNYILDIIKKSFKEGEIAENALLNNI
jgi:hypothetical protein